MVREKNYLNLELGKYIASQRSFLNFKMSEIAGLLGVSAQFYGLIEKGRVPCPDHALIKLISILKLKRTTIRRIHQTALKKRVAKLFELSRDATV